MTSLEPIPQGGEEVYGTAAGGKPHVLGGFGVFRLGPKQMLWSFDPVSSEWMKLPNIPEGIHHPGFAAVGDKLLLDCRLHNRSTCHGIARLSRQVRVDLRHQRQELVERSRPADTARRTLPAVGTRFMRSAEPEPQLLDRGAAPVGACRERCDQGVRHRNQPWSPAAPCDGAQSSWRRAHRRKDLRGRW
jgi:hypothetical protein